jgi:hypothetical protein
MSKFRSGLLPVLVYAIGNRTTAIKRTFIFQEIKPEIQSRRFIAVTKFHGRRPRQSLEAFPDKLGAPAIEVSMIALFRARR